MPEEEEGEKREDGIRQQGTEAGTREDGKVQTVDGGEKKRVAFFFFLVFINSAAPELRRNQARESC